MVPPYNEVHCRHLETVFEIVHDSKISPVYQQVKESRVKIKKSGREHT